MIPRKSRTLEEPVKELIHSVAAKGDLCADDLALTDLEVCNGLLGFALNRLLTSNGGKVAHDRVNDLGVIFGLAASTVDNDLVKLRDLHGALITILLHKSGSDLVIVKCL